MKYRIAMTIGLFVLLALTFVPKTFAQDNKHTAEELIFGKCQEIHYNDARIAVSGCTYYNEFSAVIFWKEDETYYMGIADVSLEGNWMDIKKFNSSEKPILVKFVESASGRSVLVSVYQSDNDMFAFGVYYPTNKGWQFQQLSYSGMVEQELGENYECWSFFPPGNEEALEASCFAPDNNTIVVNYKDEYGTGWLAVINRKEESLYLVVQSLTDVVSVEPNKSGFMIGNGQYGVQIYAHADGNYSFVEPTEDEMVPTLEGHPL